MLSYMPSSPSENILLSLSSYKGGDYITEARLFHKKDLFEKLSQIAEIELPDPDLSGTQEELSQYLSDTNYLIPQEIDYSTAEWGEILRATVFGDNYNLANNGRILFLTAVFSKRHTNNLLIVLRLIDHSQLYWMKPKPERYSLES